MAGHLRRGSEGPRKKRKKRKGTKKGLPTSVGADLSSDLDTMSETAFELRAEILKNQSFDQGLVLGWAIVCTEMEQPYFDRQGDHITEKAMLGAASDYAMSSRVATEMHGKESGTVVHTFPLTTDVSKAFGIKCDTTGLMIAMKPDDDMLAKFKSGELTGFSIGGLRGEDEEVED